MTTPPPTEPNRSPERGRHRQPSRRSGVLGVAANVARLAYYVWRLASEWWS